MIYNMEKINDFIANFVEQFEEIESDLFTAETKFKELDEWSSLIALSLIAMVDLEYNVKITAEDIRKSTTINDLYEIVETRMQ